MSSINEILITLDSHPSLKGIYTKVVGKDENFILKHILLLSCLYI